MKIGILSKRTIFLTGKIKRYLEKKGHEVEIFTYDNLVLDKNLLKKDFFILKSKKLFFFYAGYFLEAFKIPVIPRTDITSKIKNRIDAYNLIKEAGLLQPFFYYGTLKGLERELKENDFPLVQKPIVGSHSRGVKILRSKEELKGDSEDLIYLQEYVEGVHYNVYFIGDEICPLQKPPLSHEHVPMNLIPLTDDVKEIVLKWKDKYNQLFGHLDIIREKGTNKLFVVDPGSFPVFVNWKLKSNPAERICELILEEYQRVKE
ncbi:MAG: ATP-grasp domain-containing protein [Promethearchaeota archaeon]